MLLTILAIFLALVIFLVLVKYQKMYRIVKNVPGPRPLPLLGNTLELGFNTAELLQNLLLLMRKYGNVVRLCLGSQVGILLTEPEYIAQILTETEGHFKGDLYKFVVPLVGDGIITSTGNKWVKHRRIMNAAFTTKQLIKYVDVFKQQSDLLVDRLRQFVDLGEVDIIDPVFAYSLNSICKTTMDVDLTKDTRYNQYVNKLSDLIFRRFMSPLKMSDFLYRFTNDYQDTKKYEKAIDDFVLNAIIKRKQMRNSGNSLLDQLFYLSGEDVLTDREIIDEVKSLIFAGSDTVGITLTFAMYELSRKPEIQDRLLEEIDFVLGDSGEVNYENLHELKYMECVLKETMRLYSPGVFLTRMLPSDTYLDDLFLPADSLIIIFLFGLHRSPEFYPNPEDFDPDRFLPENCENRPPYSYIPFGVGVRACIGQKFGWLEAKVGLTKIIRNFELAEGRPGHKPILVATGSLKAINGLPVKIKSRRN